MKSMKVPVYSLKGKVVSKLSLARAFSKPVRPDLIKKAFLAEMSESRQPYGANKLAGKRTSAHYHGMRRYRYTMMNREMSRMKRIHGNVGFLAMRARFVPQAVKGRKAHPPKPEKNWLKKINRKERRKALLSAIAATAKMELVKKRGHKTNGLKDLPIIIEDKFQDVKKAKDVVDILNSLGLKEELKRVRKKKERAGRGKMRGRRYKKRKGPLLVIKDDRGILKAKNIPGIDVVELEKLTVGLLAPGASPGRLCIWTKSAVNEVGKW